jgi:hypothetical protein
MTARLDVIRLGSNDVGVCISAVNSLLEALKIIRQEGRGEYLVYSQKSGRRRFYEVTEHGNIVFRERDEAAITRR